MDPIENIAPGSRPSRPLRKPPLRHDPILPFILLAAGLTLVAAMSRLDERGFARQPWGNSMVLAASAEDLAQADAVYRAGVRTLGLENYPQLTRVVDELDKTPQGAKVGARLRDVWQEKLTYLRAPPEVLRPFLAEGRLPEPGKPEVLAGDLARLESLRLDAATFEVVGRLERGIRAFSRSYVLFENPVWDPLFTEEKGTKEGLLFPQGPPSAANGAQEKREDRARIAGGFARTSDAVSWGTVVGLVLLVIGGEMALLRFFRWLAQHPSSVLAPILGEMSARRRLLQGIHVLLFGLFFSCMAAAILCPSLNACLGELVAGEFTDGSLGYIGSAYASKNIALAACATFFHNFAVATVTFTLLPSLVIPFAGLLKNALSFAVVGFAMAPNWTGDITPMVYHSVTLVVELEAYVLATFAVCVLPVRIGEGLAAKRALREWRAGLIVVGSGALLSALILAAAACYEAATLILLR